MKVEIEVPDAGFKLASGLGNFGAAVRKALADGWDMGQDLPVVVTAAIADLLPSIQGIDQLDDEAKADPMGMGLAVIEGLRPAFKKPEAPAA